MIAVNRVGSLSRMTSKSSNSRLNQMAADESDMDKDLDEIKLEQADASEVKALSPTSVTTATPEVTPVKKRAPR